VSGADPCPSKASAHACGHERALGYLAVVACKVADAVDILFAVGGA